MQRDSGPLAVLGPGALGLALAGLAAERGLEVRLAGRDRDHADRGLERIRAAWEKRGVASVRGPRACGTLEEALDGAATILEALPESLEGKRTLWRRITAIAPAEALLLSGSSSLPVSAIRAGILAEPRLLGFHLFLPVHRMAALELVAEPDADPGLLDRAEALGSQLGRRCFRVLDGPGYAASRMALAQGLEAMRLLERGVAGARELDGLMVHGYGHPVGPLELSDRIGLDLRLSIAEGLYAATGSPAYEPPRILRELVAAGRLGRKTGQGVYTY